MLQALGGIIDNINTENKKVLLDIYTTNTIDEEILVSMTKKGNVKFNKPVSYDMVSRIIEEHDVVVYVESLNKKYEHIARLSFSTKITDYLASGKCILAIGPGDIAPIEYLRNEDAAIIANNCNDLTKILTSDNLNRLIEEYSRKGYECGLKNHNKNDLDNMVLETLMNIK